MDRFLPLNVHLMDEIGRWTNIITLRWTSGRSFDHGSSSWTNSDGRPRLSFWGGRVDGFLTMDRPVHGWIRTTDHKKYKMWTEVYGWTVRSHRPYFYVSVIGRWFKLIRFMGIGHKLEVFWNFSLRKISKNEFTEIDTYTGSGYVPDGRLWSVSGMSVSTNEDIIS